MGTVRLKGALGMACTLTALAGCGASATAEQKRAKPVDASARWWLGSSFAGLPLTHQEGGDFIYGDCTAEGDSGCAPPLEIQNTAICNRYPTLYSGPGFTKARLRTVRGALTASFGDGTDLYTGSSSVRIFTFDHPTVSEVIAGLRPEGGTPPERFPRPAFPRRMIAELRRVDRVFRHTHSVTKTHRELGMSRAAVRQRLSFWRALRRAHATRPARCEGVTPGDLR